MPADALGAWMTQLPEPVCVTISRQDIARFAVAVGAADPVHFDPATARQQGHADVIAPDLYYLALRTGVFNVVPREELHEEGTALRDIPPITFRQAMAGETRAELHQPFVAGQTVEVTSRRSGVRHRQGRSGPLTFIDFEYRYQAQKLITVERFTRVYR